MAVNDSDLIMQETPLEVLSVPSAWLKNHPDLVGIGVPPALEFYQSVCMPDDSYWETLELIWGRGLTLDVREALSEFGEPDLSPSKLAADLDETFLSENATHSTMQDNEFRCRAYPSEIEEEDDEELQQRGQHETLPTADSRYDPLTLSDLNGFRMLDDRIFNDVSKYAEDLFNTCVNCSSSPGSACEIFVTGNPSLCGIPALCKWHAYMCQWRRRRLGIPDPFDEDEDESMASMLRSLQLATDHVELKGGKAPDLNGDVKGCIQDLLVGRVRNLPRSWPTRKLGLPRLSTKDLVDHAKSLLFIDAMRARPQRKEARLPPVTSHEAVELEHCDDLLASYESFWQETTMATAWPCS